MTIHQEEFYDGPAAGSPIRKSFTRRSRVPPECANNEPSVLGVDEAGRGPVLGPMVYGICYCPLTRKEQLGALGFADSKTLKESDRDALFTVIRAHNDSYVGYAIRSISPQDISEAMLRKNKYNLNAMAHDATIELIRETLLMGVNLAEVYVDTVGPADTYQAKLSRMFPGIAITVSKKADSIYPIVSAASIAAKVTRDEVLRDWIFAEKGLGKQVECESADSGVGEGDFTSTVLGEEGDGDEDEAENSPLTGKREVLSKTDTSKMFGSGYPGDPTTVRWLKENMDPVFGYPGLIRFSWSTADRLLETNAIRVVWPDPEKDSESIESMLRSKTTRSKKHRTTIDNFSLARVESL